VSAFLKRVTPYTGSLVRSRGFTLHQTFRPKRPDEVLETAFVVIVAAKMLNLVFIRLKMALVDKSVADLGSWLALPAPMNRLFPRKLRSLATRR
jgi:hypothetical protein